MFQTPSSTVFVSGERSPRPIVLEARCIGTPPSDLGTPSQPSIRMTSPAEVNRLSGTKPTERKSEGARLGLVHSEIPATVVDRRPQHLAIRLLPIFVHVSAPEVSLPQNQPRGSTARAEGQLR